MPQRKRTKKNDELDYLKRKIRKLKRKIRDRSENASSYSASIPDEDFEPQETEFPVQRPDDWDFPDDASVYDTLNQEIDQPICTVNQYSRPVEAQPGAQSKSSSAIPSHAITAIPGTSAATASAVPSTSADAMDGTGPAPAEPAENDAHNDDVIDLDDDILQILGDDPSSATNYGKDIRTELATRFVHGATEGITKENLIKELLDKQVPPSAPTEPDDDGAAGDAKKRYLILISTVMTWGCTKPLDPENPELPFIETDFRKRKPHLNYKIHYDAENEVIGLARKYRSQIGAIVVCAGATYGGKEDVLYYWFQKAWECEPLLPILGRGSNLVPLINVLDLAQIVYNLVTDFPKKLFILAVEQNVTKQREIIKPLGRCAGTGMFRCIPPEDAFLIPEIDQRIFDLMTLNLAMEPAFIVETMAIQWTTELTFAEYAPVLMKEFKKQRGLKPFKIIVYGPPIVGKTVLARQICENYGLVYISPETAGQDVMEDMERRVAHWDEGETAALPHVSPEEEAAAGADDEEDDTEDEELKETMRQALAVMQAGLPVSEEETVGYMRKRLLCREALNRGWVLDGFPNTIPQCTILFDRGEEQESEGEEENEEDKFDEDADLYSNVLKKILPDIVVSLEATDDFICQKAMKLPEEDSRLDEEVVLNRLFEFRANDNRDITPLNFFDELDIHPLVVVVKDHMDYDMKGPYAAVSLRMGRPCRYSKLLAMIEAAEKKAKEEKARAKYEKAKAEKELEEKMQHDREEKMEYWSELYAIMREEEEQALAAAGVPMRSYLMHHIFPTLTPALLEVAKLRPKDPVDFLAEYLFKLNPNGKMLEPGYNLQAEKIMGKIKILDDALADLDIMIEPLAPPEADLPEAQVPTKPNPNLNI